MLKYRYFDIIGSDGFRLSDVIGFDDFRLSELIGSYYRNPTESDVGNRRKLTDNKGFRRSETVG